VLSARTCYQHFAYCTCVLACCTSFEYYICLIISGQEASSQKSNGNHDDVQGRTVTTDGSRAVDTIRELARKAEARGVTLESTFAHFDKVINGVLT
jgi:hypothetical protein